MARIDISIPEGSGRRRGWWKSVDGIDRSTKGGYCIEGSWLNEGEADITSGTVLVACTPRGSVKNGHKGVQVYVVTPDGLDSRGPEYDLWSQTPSLLDEIETALNESIEAEEGPLAVFSTEELQAELRRRGVFPEAKLEYIAEVTGCLRDGIYSVEESVEKILCAVRN